MTIMLPCLRTYNVSYLIRRLACSVIIFRLFFYYMISVSELDCVQSVSVRVIFFSDCKEVGAEFLPLIRETISGRLRVRDSSLMSPTNRLTQWIVQWELLASLTISSAHFMCSTDPISRHFLNHDAAKDWRAQSQCKSSEWRNANMKSMRFNSRDRIRTRDC